MRICDRPAGGLRADVNIFLPNEPILVRRNQTHQTGEGRRIGGCLIFPLLNLKLRRLPFVQIQS